MALFPNSPTLISPRPTKAGPFLGQANYTRRSVDGRAEPGHCGDRPELLARQALAASEFLLPRRHRPVSHVTRPAPQRRGFFVPRASYLGIPNAFCQASDRHPTASGLIVLIPDRPCCNWPLQIARSCLYCSPASKEPGAFFVRQVLCCRHARQKTARAQLAPSRHYLVRGPRSGCSGSALEVVGLLNERLMVTP